ncbi:hypothetical protein BJY01DRAFT_63340 [Aspergillus pseudoustus]|uniref:PH domain-containing protein n=1 Tax=Aspergillus pseudoustus TaxID=1810923 RepID=A0ABR4JAA7_9EURO
MMATEKQDYGGVGGGVSAPAKFSRYRSVRKAASSNPQGLNPLNTSVPAVPTYKSAPVNVPQDASDWTSGSTTTIKKSMSRYRRQKPSTPNSTSDAPPPPPLPISPEHYAAPEVNPVTTFHDDYPAPRPSKDSYRPDVMKPRGRFMNAMRIDTHGKGFFGVANHVSSESEQEEREKDRKAAMDRLTGGCVESPATPSSRQRPATRGRAATDREAARVTDNRHKVDNDASRRHSHNETKRKSFKEAMKFSRPKGKTSQGPDGATETIAGNLFPGIDAPVSAVNAGERNVLVQYKRHSLKLSVSPSTSAHDILVSASHSVSEIEPSRFILMESFTAQGLERPLRQYECVRDVMNSWAHDTENPLIIVPGPSMEALDFLDSKSVPKNPPADVTFHIYYSQKPRKWDKRYLTLRSDGQITLSKKEMAKDQTNVCHLSDFDIYSPTPTFLSQRIKPPKKICYAIKSQQKSSMFLTTENFIHFFATNDKSVADGWYRAVQTWRSWYMVNTLGAGQIETNTEPKASANRIQEEPSPVRPFKPLLATIDTYSSEEGDEPLAARSRKQKPPSRGRLSREHGPPPSSFPKSMEAESPTAQLSEGNPFSSSGLLGRTYTLRQKAMKEREEREKREADVLFSQGLVGGTMNRQFSVSRPGSRTNSITSAQVPDLDGLLKRSESVKQGKPLVDLTPIYQEPPQHTRKGRGVTVDSGAPLIDSATGPEPVGGVSIPPAKTWRRPTAPAEPPSSSEIRTRNRSNTARSASSRYRHPNTVTSSVPQVSPIDAALSDEQGFLPNSLLARTGTGILPPMTGTPIGHGVATGDRNATKPMLDVAPQSPFAEGSLLRGL